MELIRCTKCLLPQTHETITFNDEGICNICQNIEFKNSKIDWNLKKSELDNIIEHYKNKYDYDCIIPYSGGKDSTWTLYYLVKEYKIKPLIVRFDHGFLRPNLLANTHKVIKKLGVDFYNFTPNWNLVKRFMLQSFIEKGDFCWHCHTGIFAYPMWVALQKNIPLVIWGEPSAEYTSYYGYNDDEEVDETRFNRFVNLGMNAQDMEIRLGDNIDKRDLKPFTYPPIKDLNRIKYRSICLGSYIPWDVNKQSKIIADELGWNGDKVENVPENYSYEKIECYMQGVRDYIKYIKRGYARTTHLTSIDIRNERLNRQTAFNLVKQYEGKEPRSLEIFLKYTGLTREEFYEIALCHIISPWEFNVNNIKQSDKLHDHDKWMISEPMNRIYTEQQILKWRNRSK